MLIFLYKFIVVISVILTMNKTARIGEVLEFLKTPIPSSDHGTIRISKASLVDIRTCLHNLQENIEFLQLETKLQQEEL